MHAWYIINFILVTKVPCMWLKGNIGMWLEYFTAGMAHDQESSALPEN